MIEKRFWSKIRVTEGGCWPWNGANDGRGYGKFKVGGSTVRAHRLAYELTNGHIPAGKDILHSCDNPACCNPAHLSIGTHRENMADMARKGRAKGGGRAGEANHRAKLTQANVIEIKALFPAGLTNRAIAARYGVGDDIISKIRTGKAWTHV